MFVCNETYLPDGENLDHSRLAPPENHADILYTAASKVVQTSSTQPFSTGFSFKCLGKRESDQTGIHNHQQL